MVKIKNEIKVKHFEFFLGILENEEKKQKFENYSNKELAFMIFSIICVVALVATWLASVFSIFTGISFLVGTLILYILIAIGFSAFFISSKSIKKISKYFKVVWYVLLTQLPIKESSSPHISTRLPTTYKPTLKENSEKYKKNPR